MRRRYELPGPKEREASDLFEATHALLEHRLGRSGADALTNAVNSELALDRDPANKNRARDVYHANGQKMTKREAAAIRKRHAADGSYEKHSKMVESAVERAWHEGGGADASPSDQSANRDAAIETGIKAVLSDLQAGAVSAAGGVSEAEGAQGGADAAHGDATARAASAGVGGAGVGGAGVGGEGDGSFEEWLSSVEAGSRVRIEDLGGKRDEALRDAKLARSAAALDGRPATVLEAEPKSGRFLLLPDAAEGEDYAARTAVSVRGINLRPLVWRSSATGARWGSREEA